MGRTATANGKLVHPLMRDEKVADLLEDEGQRRVTREYTEEAVKFMEASSRWFPSICYSKISCSWINSNYGT